MQNNPRDILFQVLTITGYTNDKDAYIKDFFALCQQEALLTWLESLSQEKKEEVLKKLAQVAHSPTQIQAVLQENFTDEEYKTAMTNATAKYFDMVLQAIYANATPEQINKLQTYMDAAVQPH